VFKRIRYEIPIVTAAAIGTSYVLFLVFVTPFMDNARQQPQQEPQPAISTVVFGENASLDETPNHGIYPKIITVIIGVNNTVRWINQDSLLHSIVADNDNDPDFFNATSLEHASFNTSDNTGKSNFLLPGQIFEFTFTKAGVFGYHGVPGPQMRGTVIVLPISEK
jgi:plastocyanin